MLMTTITIRRKAFASITSGTRLLLFAHPLHPDAGIQVPAGTMAPGEVPAAAVLREASEETGLTTLRLARWIGRDLFDAHPYGRDEFHDRWFYHLVCDGSPPDTWRYWETDPSDGPSDPIPFDFFWADLAGELPALIAGHDRFIPELRAQLGIG
jgi:8-oxo-dGTP pyrophosphatase MutT (NUDIX family)